MELLACKCLENSKITVSNDIQMKTKLFGKNDFEQARFIKLLSISFGPLGTVRVSMNPVNRERESWNVFLRLNFINGHLLDKKGDTDK